MDDNLEFFNFNFNLDLDFFSIRSLVTLYNDAFVCSGIPCDIKEDVTDSGVDTV